MKKRPRHEGRERTVVDLCYLNGAIVPLSEARIDPLDRGFVFGDGLYETVKVLNGVILHFEPHLERLAAGLERVQIPFPERLEEACRRVVEENGLVEGSLYIQVSRGVAPRVHFPPRGMTPTVLVLPAQHPFDPPASREMSALTVPDWRWRHSHIKTTSLMATVLGKLAARDADADEVLFVNRAGEIAEGGSTNLFVRREERLETYPLDGRILAGVTRSLLLDLVARQGVKAVERAPRMGERDAWQEMFVCGTLTGVQGVVSVDGQAVGDGRIGDWTRRFAALLATYEEVLAHGGAGIKVRG